MKKVLLLICFGTFSIHFSQITEQINTSNFSHGIVPPSTQVDGLNRSEVRYQDITVPEFKNPEIVNYQNSPKSQNLTPSSNADKIVDDMFPNKDKVKLTTTVDIRDTHEKKLNTNVWVPKTTKKDNAARSIPRHSTNNAKTSAEDSIAIVLGALLVIIIVFMGKAIFYPFKKKYNYNQNNTGKTKIIVDGGGCFQLMKLVGSIIAIIYILFLIFKGCSE